MSSCNTVCAAPPSDRSAAAALVTVAPSKASLGLTDLAVLILCLNAPGFECIRPKKAPTTRLGLRVSADLHSPWAGALANQLKAIHCTSN